MEDSQPSKKRRLDQWRPDEHAELANQRLKSQAPTKKRRKGGGYRPSYGDGVSHPRQNDSYRPSRATDDRQSSRVDRYPPSTRSLARNYDHYSPSSHTRPSRPEDEKSHEARNESSKKTSNNRSAPQKQHFQPNNHSTKARKSNPSTRIRSLRKQLAHPSAATMPANILAEKERELQYLLDSQKEKSQDDQKGLKRGAIEKKMLQQYHMVRFFERKKAERNLKRARKELQELAEGEKSTASTKSKEKEIQRHQCDLLYCLFAPLGEKYIALFAGEGQIENPRLRKGKNKGEGPAGESLPEENPHVIRVSQQAEEEAFKPPHWYIIEVVLKEDQAKQATDSQELVQVPTDNNSWTSVTLSPSALQQLEALRDGRSNSGSSSPSSLTGFNAGLAVRPKGPVAGNKRKAPSWQDETDEPIDPMDADSDDSEDGGMKLTSGQGEESESDDEFFE